MKYWYDTELAITLDNFFCPCNEFFNALALWLINDPKLKIAYVIVQSIAVYVMNILVWIQRAPKMLLHNVAVFKNPFKSLPRRSLYPNSFVPILGILAFHRADTTSFTRRTASRSIARTAISALTSPIVHIAIAMYPYWTITAFYWTSWLMWCLYGKPIHITSPAQLVLDVMYLSFASRIRTCFRCFRFALHRIVTSTKSHCGVCHWFRAVFNDAYFHEVIIAQSKG